MDKQVHVYDPAEVILLLDGIYISGFSEDQMIEIEQNEDDMIPKVDVRGNVHYTVNHDKTATLTLGIMSSSPQLPLIRGLARKADTFSLTLTDMNDNGVIISNDECVILKTPNYSRGKEAESLEVEIFIPFIEWE